MKFEISRSQTDWIDGKYLHKTLSETEIKFSLSLIDMTVQCTLILVGSSRHVVAAKTQFQTFADRIGQSDMNNYQTVSFIIEVVEQQITVNTGKNPEYVYVAIKKLYYPFHWPKAVICK